MLTLALELTSINSALTAKLAVTDILDCNSFTSQFGLTLTPSQAVELTETRGYSLRQTGRVEFGGGVLGKLIDAFYTSPFIHPQNYADTLHSLTEMFYYYKNDTLDLISDDRLIEFMRTAFDGPCHGSLDLLAGRELSDLAHNLRFGRGINYTEPINEEEYDDEY